MHDFEMEDPRKVTHEYLDAVKGKYSVSQISEEEKKASYSYGIKPNNDPVEQSFACFAEIFLREKAILSTMTTKP